MSSRVYCPACGRRYRMTPDLEDTKVRCAVCGRVFMPGNDKTDPPGELFDTSERVVKTPTPVFIRPSIDQRRPAGAWRTRLRIIGMSMLLLAGAAGAVWYIYRDSRTSLGQGPARVEPRLGNADR